MDRGNNETTMEEAINKEGSTTIKEVAMHSEMHQIKCTNPTNSKLILGSHGKIISVKIRLKDRVVRLKSYQDKGTRRRELKGQWQ